MADSRRPGRVRLGARSGNLSARVRIIGAMTALLTFAFACAVGVSAHTLATETDELVGEWLGHSAASVSAYAHSPAGRAETSVDGLLRGYLHDTDSHPTGTQFSMIDNVPQGRSAVEPLARLDQDPKFLELLRSSPSPARGKFRTPAGLADYAVIPVKVQGDPRQGSIVAVEFRSAVAEPMISTVGTIALAGALAIVAGGLASWVIAGRVLAPLRLVRETADSINEHDLHARIHSAGKGSVGTGDVAALTNTFNGMLDRLETAFASRKQFVDDAGHELRTPLTVIRGHLETMGESASDRQETIALVTDELDRMTRIVNDVMVLAASDQPGFVVRADTSLMDLLTDTLAKARMLGPQHWVLDELAEGNVRVDGQRLTQALMQLAANAVEHTPADGTIGMGSRVSADKVLLWVRDTGRGMSEQEQQGIFTRFSKAAGAQHSAGTGLGLSIVKHIAQAHGGTVLVRSSQGAGATFTLELPQEEST